MFPLLEKLTDVRTYIATDYAPTALDILQKDRRYDSFRTACYVWDFTKAPNFNLSEKANAVLCIFALSAIDDKYHAEAICNLKSQLVNGGVILFRDYGLYDMTMFRHSERCGEYLFRRPDGTLAYYFSLQYLRELAESAGLQVMELDYATVEVRNRKTTAVMKRVFVHAVLRWTVEHADSKS
jgi:hypothetical protein